jgi:hypothetical protein
MFSNINLTESYKQDSFNMCLKTLVRFKNFALLYNRVGAGAARAEAASKFLPGAGAA